MVTPGEEAARAREDPAAEAHERRRRGLEHRNEPGLIARKEELERAERSGEEAAERLDRGVVKLLPPRALCGRLSNGLVNNFSSAESFRGIGEADLRGVATHSCIATFQLGMSWPAPALNEKESRM